jgi:hypothetical protein
MGIFSNPALWILAAIVGFIALMVFLVQQQQANQARFFAQLDALGGGVNRILDYGGHRIQTEYYAGSKNSPSRLSLITPVTAPGSWQIAREGAADAFLERLGLEGKIAVNVPDFDSRFHIVSDDEGFAVSYFSSPKKREAVAALFAAGCARVELGESGLKAVWSPFQIKSDTSAQFVKDSLPRLAVLAEELPQSVPFTMPQGMTKKQFDKLFGVSFFCAIAGFFLMPFMTAHARPLSEGEIFWESLHYSVPAMAAFLFAMTSLLKGKSWFLPAMLQSVIFALLMFPLGGFLAEADLNARLDTAQAETHQAPVIYKYETHSKNSTTYHVRMRSWRPGHDSEELSIGWNVYQRIQPRQTVAVVATKPGHFNHEWVVACRFDPLPAAP